MFGTEDLSFTDVFCVTFDAMSRGRFAISSQFADASGLLTRQYHFVDDDGLGWEMWRTLVFDVLPPDSNVFNLIFHAQVMSGMSSAVALDNLRILNQSCTQGQC